MVDQAEHGGMLVPQEEPVDLGNGKIGIKLVNPGEKVELGILRGNAQLYIKTSSGNMYLFQKKPEFPVIEIINARKSRQTGGKLNVLFEDIEELTTKTLSLGERFDFGVGSTSYISEALIVNNDATYDQNELNRMTQGRKSTIPMDFKRACLPIGAEPQS